LTYFENTKMHIQVTKLTQVYKYSVVSKSISQTVFVLIIIAKYDSIQQLVFNAHKTAKYSRSETVVVVLCVFFLGGRGKMFSTKI